MQKVNNITYIKLLGNGEALISYNDGTYETVKPNQIVDIEIVDIDYKKEITAA